MKVKSTPIDAIKPYDANPRKNDQAVDAVAKSLHEFGWQQPIVVDSQGVIIVGHTRWKAAKSLSMDTVPVVVADDLTPEQARAYRIADNKTAEMATWDVELLEAEVRALDQMDVDLSTLCIDDKELAALLQDEVVEDDFEPEPPDDPITQPDDLWLLGEHRVLCGDSTKAEDVDRLMSGERVGLCFTSPPYLSQREYSGNDITLQNIISFIDCASIYCDVLCVNLGIARKNGEVVCYWDEYTNKARKCGFILSSWNVWNRSGSGFTVSQATAMFPIEHEFVFVYSKGNVELARTVTNKHAGSTQKGTVRQFDGKTIKSKSIVRDKRPMGTVFSSIATREITGHPAMFPIEFPLAYIASFIGSVYDPFLGSGTTLIAAEQLGRKCFGMEISPAYCDVIVKRWEEFTGKKAERE